MKKVIVIGSSGAGKSTLAQRLSETVGLPLVHLDKIHWKPNWVEPSKDEWRAILAEAIKGDSWIMDGNYSSTLEMRVAACDTVIFLDLPRIVCLYRILKRVASYYGENRPDMAEGCNEQFDWKFLVWVWNYPKRSKPLVEKMVEKYGEQISIIRLKSKRDVESFFAALETN